MPEIASTERVFPLVENQDYYLENGLMVLTAAYHLRRGYCCDQGCRHCPYAEASEKKSEVDADHKNETR